MKPQNYHTASEFEIAENQIWNLIQMLQMGAFPTVAIPSAEPKTGHWIEHPEIETSTPEYLMFYECSECGDKQCFCKSDIHKKHFCNNCGARMVEPQESEDKCKNCKYYRNPDYTRCHECKAESEDKV